MWGVVAQKLIFLPLLENLTHSRVAFDNTRAAIEPQVLTNLFDGILCMP